MPRVGGIEDGIVWTGGSNRERNFLVEPNGMAAFRPRTFKEKMAIDKVCKEPLPEDRRLGTIDKIKKNESDIGLMSWLGQIREKVEECGMDTVFRVIRITGTRRYLENYLFDDWGAVTVGEVETWAQSLRTTPFNPRAGTRDPAGNYRPDILNAPCAQDLYNLKASYKMIQGSISTKLWASVERDLPTNPSGPEILMHIINVHQIVSSSTVRKMIKDLEKMSIKNEPGQNVETFADKVSDMARLIDGTAQSPNDLNTIVASTFMGSSTLQFEIDIGQMYKECDDVTMNGPTWQSIILAAKTTYRGLISKEKWEAAASEKEPDPLQAMKAEITQLRRQLSNQNNNGGGNANRNGGGNPNGGGGDKSKRWMRVAPGEGESESKEVSGVTYKYCGVCKRWRSGTNAHFTANHVVGKNRNKNNNDEANNNNQNGENNPEGHVGEVESNNMGGLKLAGGGFVAAERPFSEVARSAIAPNLQRSGINLGAQTKTFWCNVCRDWTIDPDHCKSCIHHHNQQMNDVVINVSSHLNGSAGQE